MPVCEVCRDVAVKVDESNSSLPLDRDSLTVSAHRGCSICLLLWQAVAAYHDWNDLGSVYINTDFIPGTLT